MPEGRHAGAVMLPAEDQRTTLIPAPAGPAPGAEVLIRIAYCALTALIIGLAWTFTSSAGTETKVWSMVIGLSAMAAMILFVGVTRSEVNKLRMEIAASEARIHGEIRSLAGEMQAEAREAFDTYVAAAARSPGGSRVQRRRPLPGGNRSAPPSEVGEIISDEFRFFMQGFESRGDDDLGGSVG